MRFLLSAWTALFALLLGPVSEAISAPVLKRATIAAGQFHTLCIKSDGTLWSWGANAMGQLGWGTADANDHSTMGQVGTDNTWVSVACAMSSSFGIKQDGSRWA